MFQPPSSGSIVSYVTKHKSNLLWKDFELTSYENMEVLPSEDYDPPNSFRVVTHNPNFPISVVSLSSVTSLTIDGEAAVLKEDSIPLDTVIVSGSKGNKYVVTFKDGIPYSCTCPGFKFRHSCRHLNEATGS